MPNSQYLRMRDIYDLTHKQRRRRTHSMTDQLESESDTIIARDWLSIMDLIDRVYDIKIFHLVINRK